MNTRSAHLLIFHGSRSQQYSSIIDRLANLVTDRLRVKTATIKKAASPFNAPVAHTRVATISEPLNPLVETAVLEFSSISLARRIISFAEKAIALNYQKVSIVPIFLSAGVHVREDIPQEFAIAKKEIDNKIAIELLDYIGNNPQLQNLVSQKFARIPTSSRILLAHGSRLPRGNVASEQFASNLHAKIAYWTVQPSLTSTVQLLMNQNPPSITILPYFLFSGRITEAIASKVTELQNQFPQTKLFLARPLGATPEFASMIVEAIS